MSGATMTYSEGRFVRLPQARVAPPQRRGRVAPSSAHRRADRFIAGSQHVGKPAGLAVMETVICLGSIAAAAFLWLGQ